MFQLDMRSGKTVYEQVIDNIKELIVTGVLPQESRLPSVRELSRQLAINPNTVQKAFKELERDGFIYTVTGKGSFVSPREEIKVNDARVEEAIERIAQEFRRLTYLGVAPETARDMVTKKMDTLIEKSRRIEG